MKKVIIVLIALLSVYPASCNPMPRQPRIVQKMAADTSLLRWDFTNPNRFMQQCRMITRPQPAMVRIPQRSVDSLNNFSMRTEQPAQRPAAF